MTGVTVSFEGLPSKILHLLVEVLPSAQKVGVFANANERANKRQLEEVQRAADDRGIAIVSAQVRSADDFEGAFQELKQAGASAVYATSSLLLRTERMRFANAALSAQMPTFCNALEIAQAGALLSYGADLRERIIDVPVILSTAFLGERAQAICQRKTQHGSFALSICTQQRRWESLCPQRCSHLPTNLSSEISEARSLWLSRFRWHPAMRDTLRSPSRPPPALLQLRLLRRTR